MRKYDPQTIEPKWQKLWADTKLYAAVTGDKTREKYYMLTEFPYPSGAGLHAGHTREYTLGDVMARHKRMQGYNVLYPMGYDAFGLPTENYAIKHKIAPQKATADNVATFRQQFDAMGFSFDWDREVNTTDPHFYKWTQWLFLKFYEKGLAYQAEMAINWCPKEKTGLANEEVVNGVHERCGTPVEKKLLKQWMFRITDYADRLIEGLKTVDYPPRIADQQVNWIGRSEGAEITWEVCDHHGDELGLSIETFTTRKDTLPGVTFIVVAPESSLLDNLTADDHKAKVHSYRKQVAGKSDLQRQGNKAKTGVPTGRYAKNPFNGTIVPIYAAEYVLAGYGTGIVMGMPGHDERDREFAFEHNLPIILTIDVPEEYQDLASLKIWKGSGKQINSGEGYDGLDSKDAAKKIFAKIQAEGKAKPRVNYKLRDWIFSRQHYWGEPIPIIHCPHCFDAASVKPAATIEFADPDSYQRLLEGTKSSITRAATDNYTKIEPGQIIKLENIENHDAIYAKVTDVRTYKDIDELAKDTATVEAAFGRSFKDADELAAHYEKHRPGYQKTISEHGLIAWDVEVLRAVVPVPEDQLPVTLPVVKNYEPTDTGESPLAAVPEFVNTTCPKCGGPAKRETDTMPNWAGSNWYYLRYMDAHNDREFAGREALEYWRMADLYLGGMEHTTLHLLYSRFVHQFLYDQGLVPTPEPYAARRGQGIVLAADGRKMSKSIGNVVNPTDIIATHGADTLRLYILFMAPYDETTPWSEARLNGASRFVYKVWTLAQDLMEAHTFNRQMKPGPGNAFETAVDRATHKAIKKIHDDLGGMRFNTAVSALMEYVNFLNEPQTKAELFKPESAALAWRSLNTLVQLLAPITPHLSEELWQQLGWEGSVHVAGWPKYDPELLKEDFITVVVQVNGKVRANLTLPTGATDAELAAAAKADHKVVKFLGDSEIVKTIVIPRKVVNFVVK